MEVFRAASAALFYTCDSHFPDAAYALSGLQTRAAQTCNPGKRQRHRGLAPYPGYKPGSHKHVAPVSVSATGDAKAANA